MEQPQASGTREALWNGPPLTRGVRGVLCFSGVVRLFERAEEGCEGLKHVCYDLPCVYFLSSLCHDIKNKIDRLIFNLKNNGLRPFGMREAPLERRVAATHVRVCDGNAMNVR